MRQVPRTWQASARQVVPAASCASGQLMPSISRSQVMMSPLNVQPQHLKPPSLMITNLSERSEPSHFGQGPT